MVDTYQFTVKTGDIVLMPGGTPAIVMRWDIVCGGNCKLVDVYPFTGWLHRQWLAFTGKTRFADRDINTLEPLHHAARKQ